MFKSTLDDVQDPDIFGEKLRNLVFNQGREGVGCYTTFETLPGFEDLKGREQRADVLSRIFCHWWGEADWDSALVLDMVREASVVTKGHVTAAWHWDADGTLLVGWNGRWAINNDCKKDHGWEWVEED